MGPLDRYTCEQVFRRLDDYVDRELAPAEIERVEEHLATCAECASEVRFERSLLKGLKDKLRHIDVPPSAVQRVEAVLKGRLRREGGDAEGGPEG